MTDQAEGAGAIWAAALGSLLSLPVLMFAWILALGALTYGIPSGEGQLAVPLGRELTIWGLIEAAAGTLGVAAGVGQWLSGRRRSAAWLLWTPVFVLIAGLIFLAGFVVYLQATGPHR